MKKYLKFLVLAPCLMSVLCDPSDDDCFLEEPEAYEVNVENISETYTADDIIWINSKISSFLIDGCTSTDEPEFISDAEVFLDGQFVLKLNDNLNGLNAEVFNEAEIVFDVGEAFTFNTCSEAINYRPVLTDDNLFYEYRIGISIDTPGDYCIVNARDSYFNFNNENNAQIFDTYNTIGDRIKFESCDITFTRNGTNGYYFFIVE